MLYQLQKNGAHKFYEIKKIVLNFSKMLQIVDKNLIKEKPLFKIFILK